MGSSELRLGDVVTLQRGNTYKSALLGKPGPVLLGLATICRNGGFRSDSLRTYGGDSDERMLLRSGDLYVSLKDVTQAADLLGAVARVPNEVALGRLTQDTVKLEIRNSEIPRNYIYWLLRTPQYRAFCKSRATGTTNLGLAREDFLSLPVPIPEAREHSICTTLEHLEEKIALNRRTNETLEQMARTVFKSWFIDFDPVREKQQGKRPFGMNDNAAALFPGGFEKSELGEMPKGWRIGGVLEVAELISGGTPKTSRADFWDGTVLWASAKDVSQAGAMYIVDTERKITELGLNNSSTKIVPKYATAVVARGATTGRFTMFGCEMAMNQTCYALNSKRNEPFYLNSLLSFEIPKLVSAAHGSVFDTITTTTFGLSKLIIPDEKVISVYEKKVSPIFNLILNILQESNVLIATRDLLLSRLFSGELATKEMAS